jgi:hypothetical protein
MADLRNQQLKDRYQTLVTVSDTSSDPTSGTLENGRGTPLQSVTVPKVTGLTSPTADSDAVNKAYTTQQANLIQPQYQGLPTTLPEYQEGIVQADFKNSRIVPPDFTFTRADTALAKVKGLYKRVPANKPLIDADKGLWIPKALTNLFRDSEPASGGTNVTFTAGNLGQFEVDNYINFAGGGVSRSIYDVASAPANSSLGTVAFICEKIAGGEPVVNSGTVANDDIQAIWGNGSVTSVTEVYKEQYGNIWFIRVKATANATATAATGIIQNSAYTGTGVRVSAIMAVDGHVDLTLLDYIRTTGASATRAVTDIRNTDFPEFASLQGYIDVEITASSNINRLLNIGEDNSNRIVMAKSSGNLVYIFYQVAGSIVWRIDSSAITIGRYRISWFVESGNIKLYIDNATIGTSTSTYTPNGTNLVLGGDITGTGSKFTDGGFFGLYIDSGITETQLLEQSAFNSVTELADFKRMTFDDVNLTTSVIATLESRTL